MDYPEALEALAEFAGRHVLLIVYVADGTHDAQVEGEFVMAAAKTPGSRADAGHVLSVFDARSEPARDLDWNFVPRDFAGARWLPSKRSRILELRAAGGRLARLEILDSSRESGRRAE